MSYEPRCTRCKNFITYDDGHAFNGMCESCYVSLQFDAMSHEEQETALAPLPVEIEQELPF